ncbi:MAG: glycosyltransferase family 4 protein, partial [Acidimicrobiales bacterium]
EVGALPAPLDIAAVAGPAGLRRVAMVAWRDLGDPEAGGSELHAHEIAKRWAAAGIEVVLRTSAANDGPERIERDGYEAVRRSGRYKVFGSAPADVVRGRLGPLDGLVEIWNGMPFLSPVWTRKPRITFLHHVHAEMWRMVLPPRRAALGETFERRVAPRFYGRSRIVTLSESSRSEIVEMLRIPAPNVSVVAPGIDARFTPGGPGCRSPRPLILAVGRLVPVKRFDHLIRAVARLHEDRPEVELMIVGEGNERPALESLRDSLSAGRFVHLPGRLDDGKLLDSYRKAWILASTSAREGWGMTVSEAAACGTPAVATHIAGHADAVVDGVTGFLADSPEEVLDKLRTLVDDEALRKCMAKAALARASDLTWDATAFGTLSVLAGEAARRRPRR